MQYDEAPAEFPLDLALSLAPTLGSFSPLELGFSLSLS